jgi:O-acetyl-ADP-ribose deacetylase (regulator of RNase III)
MKIILIDKKQDWPKSCRKKFRQWSQKHSFQNDISWHRGDVRQIGNFYADERIAFVSPANCFGYMDGGIDAIYMKMFSGIQEKVQKEIRNAGFVHEPTHRAVLPIGCATLVEINARTSLVSAPTMVFAEPCAETRNAYYATLATLICVQKYNKSSTPDKKITTIIFPGMCTGCGKMTIKQALDQMFDAIATFESTKYAEDECPKHNIYVARNVMNEVDIVGSNRDMNNFCRVPP